MEAKRYDGCLPQAGNSAWLLAGVGAPTYLILLLFFFAGILISTILLAVPLYALDMGVSEVMLGSLVAGFVSSGVFLSFLGAALCDCFGRRSVILWAFCFFAASNVAGMLAVSPLWLLLGALMAGVGDMLFTVGGVTYLAEIVAGNRQDLTTSAAFSLWPAGSVAGSVLAGYIAEWFGFSAAFLPGIVVSAAGVCLSLILPRVKPQVGQTLSPSREVFASYKAAYDLLRANKIIRVVPILTGLGTLGWFTFRSSFYLDYLRQLGISAGHIGLLMALGSGTRILAPFLYFLLSSRIGTLAAVLFGLLFGGLGLAVTPFLTSVLALAIVGTLAQTGDAFHLPGSYALLSLGTSLQERATSIAINNTSWAIAALLGGPFWGLIAGTMGLSKTFLMAGLGIALFAASLYVRNRHKDNKYAKC